MLHFIYYGALAGATVGAIIAKRLQSEKTRGTNANVMPQKEKANDPEKTIQSGNDRGNQRPNCGSGNESITEPEGLNNENEQSNADASRRVGGSSGGADASGSDSRVDPGLNGGDDE